MDFHTTKDAESVVLGFSLISFRGRAYKIVQHLLALGFGSSL